MIHPGPGGYYRPPDLHYANMCLYVPDSIRHHYLGLMAFATYANFDEIEVFAGLEGTEEYEGQIVVPRKFNLCQNYPNPFNSTTAISYQLSAVGYQLSAVSLRIYNLLGQEVRNLVDSRQKPGEYQVVWDGRDNMGQDVASGIYLYRLKVIGDKLKVTRTRKVVLIR